MTYSPSRTEKEICYWVYFSKGKGVHRSTRTPVIQLTNALQSSKIRNDQKNMERQMLV